MKQPLVAMSMLVIMLSAGCSSSKRETKQALEELAARCHTYFSAEQIDIIDRRRNVNHNNKKAIFIGTFPVEAPQNAKCIHNFVSSSGFHFFYTINRVVL